MSAAVDVSDGLLADLGHVCDASVCGMQIDMTAIPFADPAYESLMTQLNGGDDYQLAFTAPSENHGELKQFAADQTSTD